MLKLQIDKANTDLKPLLQVRRNSLWHTAKILFCACFLFFTTEAFAQYDYLSEFENLYQDCADNEESIIFGGSYPDPWPRGLNLPVFPGGGDIQFTRFVYNNIDYPDVIDYATRERVKGTVKIEIVIDRCGRATRQRIIDYVDELYDMEAMRIMQNLPVFKPGSLNGERVKVALIVPVPFNRTTMPKKKKIEEYNYDDFDW